MDRIFFHLDVNSAFLSWSAAYLVNVLGERTDLRQIPSVVGGAEEDRHGIVLAGSIPAKRCGIRTGQTLYEAMKRCPDLVVIPPEMIRRYRNRIINIHPSLIPSFCGTGYYGLKVHEAALARGVKVTGATVHFVDEGTDTGPIILQKAVEVRQGDTPEVLQRRVMEEAEWQILPQAIDLIAQGRVTVEDGQVKIRTV